MSPKNPLPEWLAVEWHPTKNGDLAIEKITSGSNRKVWWLIQACGHEFQSRVFSRVKGANCSICTGKIIIVGINDLATTHPLIINEWHPTKNNALNATEVTAGSNALVHWIDSHGHEWTAKVNNRVKKSSNKISGCPICLNKTVLVGYNDLPTTNPELSVEWHSTKNQELMPTEVTAGYTKQVWWIDKHKHEWKTSVVNRAKGKKTGCPICAGHYTEVTKYIGDKLSSEWHPRKNGSLQPSDFSRGSDKKVWWLGKCGHEWEANINSRTLLGRGCGYCSGNKVLLDYNNFAFTQPILSHEFHPTKNSEITINDFTAGSSRKVWWQCNKGHEWEAVVSARVRGNNCPECAIQNFNYVSQPEKELFAFLTSLGLQVEQSNRSVLKGIKAREIDLYIPEKKLGVEFNGLYWHSEAQGKDKTYHQAKFEAARAAGIQLVQIWEDDWRDRKNAVLRALAHKLGVTHKLNELYPELAVSAETVYARKTQVRVLVKDEAASFLEANHIQGYANGSYYLGLEDSNQNLRAVLVLKKEAGTEGRTLNIIRYATQGTVVGGFTKLLKHAERIYQPKDFITFADHCISDGGLYEGNGFVADKILSPDYMYVVGSERKHKFGYRLKRFQNDPNLLWQDGLTERELAALNSLHRVWDAGKTRYRKTV